MYPDDSLDVLQQSHIIAAYSACCDTMCMWNTRGTIQISVVFLLDAILQL